MVASSGAKTKATRICIVWKYVYAQQYLSPYANPQEQPHVTQHSVSRSLLNQWRPCAECCAIVIAHVWSIWELPQEESFAVRKTQPPRSPNMNHHLNHFPPSTPHKFGSFLSSGTGGDVGVVGTGFSLGSVVSNSLSVAGRGRVPMLLWCTTLPGT